MLPTIKRCTNPGLRWQEFVSLAVRLSISDLLEIIALIGGNP